MVLDIIIYFKVFARYVLCFYIHEAYKMVLLIPLLITLTVINGYL